MVLSPDAKLTTKALATLDQGLGSLHEQDIFKICVKTLHPSQVVHIIGPSSLPFEQQQELALRQF